MPLARLLSLGIVLACQTNLAAQPAQTTRERELSAEVRGNELAWLQVPEAMLLRQPSVIRALNLSEATQRSLGPLQTEIRNTYQIAIREMLSPQDIPIQLVDHLNSLGSRFRQAVDRHLSPDERERLARIQRRYLGFAHPLYGPRDELTEVADTYGLTEAQRTRALEIQRAYRNTQAGLSSLSASQFAQAQRRMALERETSLYNMMTDAQRARWRLRIDSEFDVSTITRHLIPLAR